MNPHEHLRSAIEREVERARQNIEDIQALEKAVSLNVAKSRVLRATASRIGEPGSGVNVAVGGARPATDNS